MYAFGYGTERNETAGRLRAIYVIGTFTSVCLITYHSPHLSPVSVDTDCEI